jgi:hypothetical protein
MIRHVLCTLYSTCIDNLMIRVLVYVLEPAIRKMTQHVVLHYTIILMYNLHNFQSLTFFF